MAANDDGGAAFPINERRDDGAHWHSHLGLTMRDYFAAAALQGLLAFPGEVHKENGEPCKTFADVTVRTAELSYLYADAMLQERSK